MWSAVTADSMFTHSRGADPPCRVEFLALVEAVVVHLHSAEWGALGLVSVFHWHGPRLQLSVQPLWAGRGPLRALSSALGMRRRALSCCPGRDCRVHKLHSSVA